LSRQLPERVTALVLSPPLPGVGERVLAERAQQEFWYQAFHQLALVADLTDGKPSAVRAYLRHFWNHWSGPGFSISEDGFDVLTANYETAGAFLASIAWYRAGAGTVAQSLAERPPAQGERIAAPAQVLWPEHDPLFPPEWADRLEDYFAWCGCISAAAQAISRHWSARQNSPIWFAAVLAQCGRRPARGPHQMSHRISDPASRSRTAG
jgi:pimeloyl-ACP methyl ester carboxylesterase